MNQQVQEAIGIVKVSQYSFCKFISANDAGDTGGHQAGLYVPKNAIKLFFDEPGVKGSNKEKFAKITWNDGVESECRFIYYGQGTRNEYRITRLGKNFLVNDFILIVKRDETDYLGYLFNNDEEIDSFLKEFDLNREDANILINKEKNTNELSFKPRAHILILLGEELIKSSVMAIYELIKNSYDADARKVDVEFLNIENKSETKVTIKDNGTGITEEVLKNVWFEPGTDYRKPIDDSGKREIHRTPIFNRIPMGEKGVGRFAVHKLGNRIKLITRPAKIILDENQKFKALELLGYELTVYIDWKIFSQSRYLDDVSIKWSRNNSKETFLFKEYSGTFIEIGDLKEDWTRGMARQLKRNAISMLSPKNDTTKFSIDLNFNNAWLTNFPDPVELLERAPYKLSALIDDKFNLIFEYSFELFSNSNVGSRHINEKSKELDTQEKYSRNIKRELRPFCRSLFERKQYESAVIEQLLNDFEVQPPPYGSLMLELYSYDLDSTSLKDTTPTPSLVKELLREHSGIKVFKGDLRVYDYGDPNNDWLGLDLKRLQNKEWFSNNQNIGYVYLDPSTSGSLIEKTNREGFIDNYSFEHFLILLEFLLTEFKAERQADRSKWLQYNKKGNSNSFESQIANFRELIASEDLAEEEKKQKLLLEAFRLEERYEQDKNTLLIPAGVGMTASFAMHEIEKLVPRMKESISEANLDKNQLSLQIDELEDYTNGLLSVLKKGGNKPVSILSAINQSVNNYSLRLRHRKIKIDVKIDDIESVVVCDKRLLITMLMNLIDNSIYWLDTVYREKKGIYITSKTGVHNTSVLIIDNGPGFKDEIKNLVRPFFTRKEGGIGIGLYLVDTIMIQYGKLNFIFDKRELEQFNVPEMYSGAAVELIFRNRAL